MSKASRIGVQFLTKVHGKAVAEAADGEYEILIAAVKVRAKDGSDTDIVSWPEARTNEIDVPVNFHLKDLF